MDEDTQSVKPSSEAPKEKSGKDVLQVFRHRQGGQHSPVEHQRQGKNLVEKREKQRRMDNKTTVRDVSGRLKVVWQRWSTGGVLHCRRKRCLNVHCVFLNHSGRFCLFCVNFALCAWASYLCCNLIYFCIRCGGVFSLRKAHQLLQRSRFLPSTMGCNSWLVLGDLYRDHSVMQAEKNVCQMFLQCMFLFCRGRIRFLRAPMLQVLVATQRTDGPSTGDAFQCAAAA